MGHANLISVQYAGTGALKTDYTRTGKRTKWGLLCDGWNSGIRYYKNNFTDGFRTDGMHFFLGDLTPKDVTNGIVSDKVRLNFKFVFKLILHFETMVFFCETN